MSYYWWTRYKVCSYIFGIENTNIYEIYLRGTAADYFVTYWTGDQRLRRFAPDSCCILFVYCPLPVFISPTDHERFQGKKYVTIFFFFFKMVNLLTCIG